MMGENHCLGSRRRLVATEAVQADAEEIDKGLIWGDITVGVPVDPDAKAVDVMKGGASHTSGTDVTAPMAAVPTKKEPRRRWVTFEVLMVVDAKKATLDIPPLKPRAGKLEMLHPGDFILMINGRSEDMLPRLIDVFVFGACGQRCGQEIGWYCIFQINSKFPDSILFRAPIIIKPRITTKMLNLGFGVISTCLKI